MNGPRLTEQDYKNATSVVCEKCNNGTFGNVFLMKYISALLSPTGREIHAPVPTFACTKCNHINKAFLPLEEPTDQR